MLANSARAAVVWISLARLTLPDNVTFSGLSELSSVIVRVPLCEPLVVAVKVTLIVQEAAGSTLVPQLLISEKPVLAEMLVMLRVDVPVLVSVTGWGGGGHVRRGPSLQLNDKVSGISCTVPFASVMVALLDFVLSVKEIAFRFTMTLAGNVEGAVNVVAAALAVGVGLTVPQAGEQTVPFWVSVQFNP